MADDDVKSTDAFTLPTGRVINCSLFTKDAYDDKSVPAYKIELAFEEDSDGMIDLENRLLDFADEQWGEGAGDDEDLVLPMLDGGKLKRKREKRGKDGSAYDGMTVIRAHTIYNKDGVDAPGGIQVFDEDVEEISPAQAGQVYPGCFGEAAVTMSAYEDNDGNNAITLYLAAFQKTGEGERLIQASDRSTLFKPKQRGEGKSGRKRRRRR
jgi:hypothetical protein